MKIEEIAKIDLFLKQKNGTRHILDSDALIVVDNDHSAVNKLKDSAYRLNEIKNSETVELQQTWFNLFTKQVKFSVQRAKDKKEN